MEYHYPGHNFTGPGTRVVTRIYNGVVPTDTNDAATMIHDIEYLIYNDNPKMISKADDTAISNANYLYDGLPIKIGLSLRKYFNLKFDGPLQGMTQLETRSVGLHLKELVLRDPIKYKIQNLNWTE